MGQTAQKRGKGWNAATFIAVGFALVKAQQSRADAPLC